MKLFSALTFFLTLVNADARLLKKKGKAGGKLPKGSAPCDLWSKGGKKPKASKASKKYSFNRISTFQACLNLDANCNTDTETVAEIVTASKDGMTLVYTDSETGSIGFIDIQDPASPSPLGALDVEGEPTSVSVLENYAIVAVNTSADFINTSGKLVAVDITSQTVVKEWDLGGQPDSVAVSKDGKYIVIAIENERDEDLGDGIPPQVSTLLGNLFKQTHNTLTITPSSYLDASWICCCCENLRLCELE